MNNANKPRIRLARFHYRLADYLAEAHNPQMACRLVRESENPEIRFLGRELKAENGLPDL